jgi:hypothetical protein
MEVPRILALYERCVCACGFSFADLRKKMPLPKQVIRGTKIACAVSKHLVNTRLLFVQLSADPPRLQHGAKVGKYSLWPRFWGDNFSQLQLADF